MDKKLSFIKERVIYLAKFQGISVEKFLKNIGMTYGSFKGESKKTSLNSDAIGKILNLCPGLNPEWLILGNGEILKQKYRPSVKEVVEILIDRELEFLKDDDFLEFIDGIKKRDYGKDVWKEIEKMKKEISTLAGSRAKGDH